MTSDPFHPDAVTGLQDGTARIHAVTPEMMDGAAHRAARLADETAHHVVEPPASPDIVGQAVTEAATEAGTTAAHGDEVAGVTPAQLDDGDPEPPATDRSDRDRPALDDGPVAVTGAAREAGPHAGETSAAAATAAGLPDPSDTFGRYNAVIVDMARANLAATTELFAALVQARSLPEAVAINADHLRRQIDTMTTQGRELTTLARTLTFDALRPFSGILRRDG